MVSRPTRQVVFTDATLAPIRSSPTPAPLNRGSVHPAGLGAGVEGAGADPGGSPAMFIVSGGTVPGVSLSFAQANRVKASRNRDAVIEVRMG